MRALRHSDVLVRRFWEPAQKLRAGSAQNIWEAPSGRRDSAGRPSSNLLSQYESGQSFGACDDTFVVPHLVGDERVEHENSGSERLDVSREPQRLEAMRIRSPRSVRMSRTYSRLTPK